MLTVFATELNSTQSELEALLAKASALRGQIKSLKANQARVSKFIDNCKNLLTELPEIAIAELKKEIFSLFPSDQEPTKTPAPVPQVFTNFVTEVPKTEVTTREIAKNEVVFDRWNPADFEPLEYQAEDNGQLNLLQPTTTEPPEPDDYPDLASFEAAWTEWKMQQEGEAEEELAHVCAKDFFNVIDLSGENWEQLKTALKPVRQPKQFLIMKGEAASVEEAHDDDQWPEVEVNSIVSFVSINEVSGYCKINQTGELTSAYLGFSAKADAQKWVSYLAKKEIRSEVVKASKIALAKWEVRIPTTDIETFKPIAESHNNLDDQPPVAKKDFDYSYAAKVNVSGLCFYLKNPAQQILAAYFAVANRNIGKEWVDYLNLMGCNAEVRKAKRFENGAQWEVKATKISHDLILQVDKNRQSLYSSVPAGNSEYTKKSTIGNAETLENLEDLKTPQPQSNTQPEKSAITKEQKASDDAEVILKGESAKADILPNYAQQNQQKVFAGDLIRVKSNCHHKSVIGLTGVVTVASNAGCIAKFEDVGNRWLTNEQIEIVKESQLVS